LNSKHIKVKIILVEPEGPLNVGSVARLCSNFKIDQLRIVSPKCDIYSLDSVKMSLKGFSYIKESKIFNSLDDAIKDCDLVVATCGRIGNSEDAKNNSPEEISNWIRVSKNINNLALIFGRETRGLTNQELILAHKVLTIETNPYYSSLNLSHAVSIVLYEIDKCFKKNPLKKEKSYRDLASTKQIEESFNEVEELLLKVGYILKHTAKAKIYKFKKYVLRAQTSKNELNMLRGIVHQINWALNNSKNS